MKPVARGALGARLLRAAVFAAVCAVLSAVGHTMAACASVPWWAVAAGFLAVFAVAAPLAGRTRSTAGVVAALTVGQLGLHTLFGLAQQRASAPAGTAGGGSGGDAIVRTAATLVCGGGPGPLSHAQALRVLHDAGIRPAAVLAASGGGTGGGAGTGSGGASGLLGILTGMTGLTGPTGQSAPIGMQGMPGMSGMATMRGMAGPSGIAALLPSLPMLLGHLLAALATGWLLRRGDLALLRIVQLSAQGTQGLGEVTETLTDAARLRALRAALTLVRHLLAGLPGARAVRRRPAPSAYGIPPAPAAVALQHTVIRRGPPAALALAA
ncbi:hypothetical protein [Streptomyces sp. 8L]|uniref:hypothetical protein n=1 Tax=Streptomyces sp. 8L TaxID=2877242 RepID=UPI001CD42659|nr:hypothetical protein [Streptomyces sp. 8L]MCA1222075.1 hypothetical protein [Streptomyces sp. 8L]